jgi:hypothetical protein
VDGSVMAALRLGRRTRRGRGTAAARRYEYSPAAAGVSERRVNRP